MNDNRPKGTKINVIMDMIRKERRFGQIESDTFIGTQWMVLLNIILWTSLQQTTHTATMTFWPMMTYWPGSVDSDWRPLLKRCLESHRAVLRSSVDMGVPTSMPPRQRPMSRAQARSMSTSHAHDRAAFDWGGGRPGSGLSSVHESERFNDKLIGLNTMINRTKRQLKCYGL